METPNSFPDSADSKIVLCEYLTYKEWKLVCYQLLRDIIWNCEYLTYKEWKRSNHSRAATNSSACEYLTYKEMETGLDHCLV